MDVLRPQPPWCSRPEKSVRCFMFRPLLNAHVSVCRITAIIVQSRNSALISPWPAISAFGAMVNMANGASATVSSTSERTAQSDYWKEHSSSPTVEAMMLDSQAKIIDKQERPEVGSRSHCVDRMWTQNHAAGSPHLQVYDRATAICMMRVMNNSRWLRLESSGP